jgi:enamine deaminase RidA (YjgF/YER057c/UK114 family)
MALKIERFQPEGMNVRMSGGQPSYSHVVTVSGTGKIVYTPVSWPVVSTAIASAKAMRAQMEQTFKNLDRCLKAAVRPGPTSLKTNTFVTDFDNSKVCRCAHALFGVALPARPSALPA